MTNELISEEQVDSASLTLVNYMRLSGGKFPISSLDEIREEDRLMWQRATSAALADYLKSLQAQLRHDIMKIGELIVVTKDYDRKSLLLGMHVALAVIEGEVYDPSN